MNPQQYCLRWKYHHSNLQTMFSQLLDRGCFCDVTLACEGQTLKAHRVVLCACSTYFDSILTNGCSDKDPIVIMKDCKFADIKCLIEFMYKGEINVEHDQLSSLLKTAEDLRIKGLAEVSWRDEDDSSNKNVTHKSGLKSRNSISCSTTDQIRAVNSASATYSPRLNNDSDYQASCGTASAILGTASTIIPSIPLLNSMQDKHNSDNNDDLSIQPAKKKRGRPPLDDDFDSYSTPKISHVESTAGTGTTCGTITSAATSHNSSSNYNEHITNPLDTLSDDGSSHHMHAHSNSMLEHNMEIQIDEDENALQGQIIPKIERPDTPPMNYRPEYYDDDENPASPLDESGDASTSQVILTEQEEEEWRDIIKMNVYLTKGRGRRPQFWDEPFTKRVMEAIKTKDLEMKKAAQLLGVSYGTLYGRYRETYGCLKHPYRGPMTASRLQSFLTSDQPEDIIGRLQRGEITLPRAAELMNTSTGHLNALLD